MEGKLSLFRSLFVRDVESRLKKADAYIASEQWGDARLELGKTIKCLKDSDDSRREAIVRKYVEVTNHLAQFHEKEADHLADSGLTEKAVDRYNLALSLFEADADRRRIEGKLYRKSPEAPSEPVRIFGEAHCCGKQCAVPEAETVFDGDPLEYFEILVHTMEPDAADAYRSLGNEFASAYAYANQGDFDKAIGLYEKAVETHKGHGILHKEFGRALLLHGDAKRAVGKLVLARRSMAEDRELGFLLASAHSEEGNTGAALEVLKGLQQEQPDDLEVYLQLGDTCLKGGEAEQAREAYAAALKIDSDFPFAHSRLGGWALAQGDKRLAITHYGKAVTHGKSVQDMVVLADLVFQENEDSGFALELLNRAFSLDEQNRWFYMVRMGEIYMKKGHRAEAREILVQARGMIPQHQKEILEKVDAFLTV
jgi:tetratricopeptide (TPR) repeat protein